jgi:F0F1-type ATP synthase beta subunit
MTTSASTAGTKGKITQVIGPVVDVEFPAGKLPRILNALTLTNPSISGEKDNLVLENRSCAPSRWTRPRASCAVPK